PRIPPTWLGSQKEARAVSISDRAGLRGRMVTTLACRVASQATRPTVSSHPAPKKLDNLGRHQIWCRSQSGMALPLQDGHPAIRQYGLQRRNRSSQPRRAELARQQQRGPFYISSPVPSKSIVEPNAQLTRNRVRQCDTEC